jgi:predicted TIM-barrel fold metal-dependent hydrolase
MVENLHLHEFQPRSELVLPAHEVARPRHPVIDAHNHLRAGDRAETSVDELVRLMDELHVRTVVNLSGGWGEALAANVAALDSAHPGRFKTFCNLDWRGVGEAGWTERAVTQLAADVRAGAAGLKVFKELGLRIRDTRGELVMPDDERLVPIWDRAGALGVPVLIHTADPVAFFRPLDRFNERWDELNRYPDWHFYGPEFPPFEDLIAALYRLIEAHPATTFITAHVGCYPENLAFVSAMLDRFPNLYTDISARIAELGRAPYSARAWFIKHADRILFGTDIAPDREVYRTHFRFLETADEYFPYAPGAEVPPQGRWCIYGLHLPDEVLRKVYHDNAARLLKLE